MKKIVSILIAIAMVLSMITVAAAEEDKIVIRMANQQEYGEGSFSGGFQKALEMTDFFEKHPNVTFENVFVAGSADFVQKMSTIALSGSDSFDGVWISAANVGVLANNGVLMNLDDYYANANFDLKDDTKWLSKATDAFPWYQGSRYSYPFQTDCRIAFWYKPICEACGYTKDNYPTTIEEFITFCQKVSAAGYNPWAIRNAEDWTIVYEWALPFYGSGGTFERYDEEQQKWVGNCDNEICKKWLSDVRELCKTIPGDYLTTCDADVAASLAREGGAACHWTGTWAWSNWMGETPEKWADYDYTLIPSGSQYSGSSMGGWQLGIYSGASKEKADLIWEAIETIIANPEALARSSKAALSYNRDAYAYSDWAKNPSTAEGWELMKVQLQTAQPVSTPPCECAPNIYAAMWTVWQEITMSDTYSIDEAAKMLNDQVQSALDDFYGYY